MQDNGMGDTPAGTDGRVYGGDPRLIHVPDGTRNNLGKLLAAFLEGQMREGAENRTEREKEIQRLCPGCYMVVGFDMLLALARENGQNIDQLCDSMIGAFQSLKKDRSLEGIEEIFIALDPPEACPLPEWTPVNVDTSGPLHDRAS